MAIGEVSTRNASTTPLGAGEVYTGLWEDVARWDSITVAVATDVDGTLALQYSTDRENVDSTLTKYYRAGQINPPHRFTNARKWARVVYTNGADAQSYFRLQVLTGDRAPLNVPLDGTVSLNYDATVVRPSDYMHGVAAGLWQGRANWVKFGYNNDVDIGTETVWPNGATFGAATILQSPSTFTFVSSDAADTSNGVGARTLIVSYNESSNGLPATGVVTLNGTTPVVSSFSGYGINRIAVLSSGSTMWNVGDITVTNTTGGNQAAYVPATTSVTQQAIYYTPIGYQAMINDITINVNKVSGGGAPVVTFNGYAFNVAITQTRYLLFQKTIDAGVENTVTFNNFQPLVLNSSDVFWFTATTNTNNTVASVRFGLTENRIVST